MMFVDVPQVQIKSAAEIQSTVDPGDPVSTVTPPAETAIAAEAPAKPKESSKARKARIVELARQLAAEEAAQAASEETKPSSAKATAGEAGKKKKDQPGDHLIEEIRSSKREIEPAGEKQKEQIEIIDQFIKQQPSITANTREKLNAAPIGDLATIKNGEFGDNIVSETLVEILLRQGKKDKAVEVLKKLIWKFPQKKTYFAAQIEELKK
jgi:predicted Zn-dependent protease